MLTAKEQRFIREFRIDGDGANAARRAGYAPKSAKVTACRLLKKPAIAQAIANQEAEKANQNIADAQERREFLTTMQRDPTAHPIARLKAADILNKMDGQYLQRVEVSHAVPLFALPAGSTPSVSKQERG